jgi:hypothetical protein
MTQTVDSKKDDTFVATLILGVVIALVLMGYGLTKLGVFGSKKTSAAEEGLGWTDEDASAFVPPPERQEFIDAKKGIDVKVRAI